MPACPAQQMAGFLGELLGSGNFRVKSNCHACFLQGLIPVPSLLDQNGNVKEVYQENASIDTYLKKVR